jgi:hypothetical protein
VAFLLDAHMWSAAASNFRWITASFGCPPPPAVSSTPHIRIAGCAELLLCLVTCLMTVFCTPWVFCVCCLSAFTMTFSYMASWTVTFSSDSSWSNLLVLMLALILVSVLLMMFLAFSCAYSFVCILCSWSMIKCIVGSLSNHSSDIGLSVISDHEVGSLF